MRKTRVFCALLSVLLVLCSVPFGVSAKEADVAEVGIGIYEIETYEELRELLKSLETLDTECNIILQADIYQNDNKNDYELVVPANREVHIDLNGYSITRETQGNDIGLFIVKSDAALHIYDGSASQTGSCTFSEGYGTYNKAVFVNNGGNLRIDGGYYEILSPYQQGECSVIRTTSGITTIYGGTFDSSSAWGGDTISVGHDAYMYEAPQVYICDGDFYGKYQNIDISPMNNFLGYGSLFPNVYVMGGDFYICNKGADKIKPSFAYCNNGWGRVIVAEGTVYATCLNKADQKFLTGSSKDLFSQTIDDFTGAYYKVTAPPMIVPSDTKKFDAFYYERLAVLCTKEVTRNYNEETYLMFKEIFDAIRSSFDTIYVEETQVEPLKIKLLNRTTNMKYVNWYVCDESEYNGANTKWTALGDYDNVVQVQLDERPENAKSILVRCVVTNKDYTSYEDIVRVEYAPLKTAETITSVELIGLTLPTAGANPDFELTPSEEGYYINNIYWTDTTDSGSPEIVKETDVFEAGHTYRLEVWLRTNDYYKFRLDSDEYIDITATIDTLEAEVSTAGTEIAASITMEFTVPKSTVPATEPTESSQSGETEPMETTATAPAETATSGETIATDPAETTTSGETVATDPAETVPTAPSTGDEEKPSTPSSGDEEKPTDPDTEDKGILGDVNGDGKVNIKDATLIQKAAAKLTELTDAEFLRADVTADIKVNIKDATAIQKYVAKIETGYPIGKPV